MHGNGSGILKIVMIRQNRGITLIELLVVIAVISIIAFLAAPQLGLFKSGSAMRACATDIIQNMRLARAMAIKENREYLMIFDQAGNSYSFGFDGNDDGDLDDVGIDGFGQCVGAGCVKVITLADYGNISFGAGASVPAVADPVAFSFGDEWIGFEPDSSVDHIGSVYIQNVINGVPEESYNITVSNFSGSLDVQKWLKGIGSWQSWQ